MMLAIGDGDTIRVGRQGRSISIRLACIDAPELAQRPFGHQSRRDLRTRLAPGQEVILKPLTRDRSGRTVAEVISDTNLGLAMVAQGQAFADRRYLSPCDAEAYRQAEIPASMHLGGVWQVPGGITRPWDFRDGQTSRVTADGRGSSPPLP